MASADLRDELSCSICTDIYTDPVTLPCGHNYCQGCIGKTWDWQEGIDEDPSCPECRRRYRRRPELVRNLRLRKMTEQLQSTGNRNCSIHHELLKYYCYVDGVCVCASCDLVGDHRGHKVELLGEASEKKKEKLRNVLDKLTSEREETEKRVQSLQENRREGPERAAGDTETVTALFRDIREQLEALEKRVLSEISRQEDEFSLTITDLIQQLEIKNNELSRKIHHIEELCSMADPLTVLQDQESDGAAIYGAEGGDNEDRERDDMKVPGIWDVDLISETLLTGLAGIVTGVKGKIYGQEVTDMLLDINTAGNNVSISGDRKTVTFSHTDQHNPSAPGRFQYPQVLTTRSFPSGRHHWDVEGSESGTWGVGVSYPSIERGWDQSCIGNNNKSWCLYRWYNNIYTVRHDSNDNKLPHVSSCNRIRISLDYEAGRLSFYELSDPIRHLHTFTATFTEPLHAVFWVGGEGTWVRIIS
ncbi:hypothetical protein GDO86_019783 [Hymenochirus boettgeri]|uniref:Uncharacterized protein n=1 Tax=Hymenochirus boettgeri TaxID=247094 RepID=A0A8T2IE80_9PIPI|nr:hypothetical protein GDO86_019783 [Hymenochirus boettgeri]